jgi:hypothetical protein
MKVDVEDLGITVVGEAAFSHSLEHLIWTRKKDGSRGDSFERNRRLSQDRRKVVDCAGALVDTRQGRQGGIRGGAVNSNHRLRCL